MKKIFSTYKIRKLNTCEKMDANNFDFLKKDLPAYEVL